MNIDRKESQLITSAIESPPPSYSDYLDQLDADDEFNSSSPFIIYVQLSDDWIIHSYVRSTDTIEHIKDMIESKTNILFESQHYRIQEQTLPENNSLSLDMCQIVPGSILKLIPKPMLKSKPKPIPKPIPKPMSKLMSKLIPKPIPKPKPDLRSFAYNNGVYDDEDYDNYVDGIWFCRYQIIITTLEKVILTFYVNEASTIKQIRNKIYEKTQISTNHQVLIFAGKKLKDKHTLRHYKIFHRAKIYLIKIS